MAGAPDRHETESGVDLRFLPAISLGGCLAFAVGWGNVAQSLTWGLSYCESHGILAGCLRQLAAAQSFVVLWIALATAVGTLMAAESALSRRGRGLHIPSLAVLVEGALLAGIGVADLWAAMVGLSSGVTQTLFYTYEAASLLLFSLTFVGQMPLKDSLTKSAVVLACVHEAISMVLAVAVVLYLEFPPLIST